MAIALWGMNIDKHGWHHRGTFSHGVLCSFPPPKCKTPIENSSLH
jgi:hypothetical protein